MASFSFLFEVRASKDNSISISTYTWEENTQTFSLIYKAFPECMGIFFASNTTPGKSQQESGPQTASPAPSPTCPSLKELTLQGEADSE